MMRNFYGIMALVVAVAGTYLASQTDVPGIGYALLLAAACCIYKAQKEKTADRRLDTSQLAAEQAEHAQTDWDKAMADYQRIELVRTKIHDIQLSRQLSLMQQEAARLLNYVERHPERIAAANRFINYYQDRAASLSEQFSELEETKLETEQVRQVKTRLKETIFSFDEAYSAEFTKIINNQLLDMDAEITVMHQSLAAEGISNTGKEMPEVQEELQASHVPPATGIGRKSVPPRRGGVRKVQSRAAVREKVVTPDNLRSAVMIQKGIMSALALFLGTFGAHKFYQGKSGWGIAYLVFCWTFIPTLVSFVEGIRYFFMPVDDFYEQYYR